MANHSRSNHSRSASFPPKTNPMILKIDQKLQQLRESEASSTSELESISIGLSGLAGLYKCAHDALKFTTQQRHSHSLPPNNHLSLNPLLHVSSKLVDICSQSKHVLNSLKDAVHNVRSALLTAPAPTTTSAVSAYLSTRKEILKSATAVAFTLRQLESEAATTLGDVVWEQETTSSTTTSEVTRVVTCVTLINISVMGSLVQLLMSKPKSRKHGLLQRLGLARKMSGKASVLPARNGNKLADVDAAIHALLCFPADSDIRGIALKRLESMEESLAALHHHLFHIFAVLSNTRASLVNILSF